MALFLILMPLLAASPISADICYWPNGNLADNYLACPGKKACCLTGEACLSNRLCFGAKYNIAYRGACTDPEWPPADCPHVCYDEISGGWANIYACSNNTNQVFTCGGAGWVTGFCEANLSTYVWEEAHVAVAQLLPSSTTPSPSATTTTTTTTTSSNTGKSSDHTVALGAGLGVGLGVPLVSVTIGLWIFWVRTRRAKEQEDKEKDRQEQEHGYEHGDSHGPRFIGDTDTVQARELPAEDNRVELEPFGPLRRELG